MKGSARRGETAAPPRCPMKWSRLRGSPASVLSWVFQAEDGIRYRLVTGVQTCALPISSDLQTDFGNQRPGNRGAQQVDAFVFRSEERRVGKECRSRWSPYHLKKKTNSRLGTRLSRTRRGKSGSVAGGSTAT